MRDLVHELKNATRELDAATRLLMSAVETFRDIAAIKGTSKRQKANSEIAANWLRAHGFALEDGGYIPGVGVVEDNALLRRQAE